VIPDCGLFTDRAAGRRLHSTPVTNLLHTRYKLGTSTRTNRYTLS
jgi:hypothetical protein